MKNHLLLTLCVLAPVLVVWMLFRATSCVVSRETVIELAQKNQLYNGVKSAPPFNEDDIHYWMKKGFDKDELEKEFEFRGRIVWLAQGVDYRIKTPGDLSYFSEALRDGRMSENKIKNEFLMRKHREASGVLRKDELSRKEIFELAKQFGLTKSEGFAPPFSSGDAAYWEGMHLSAKRLKQELGYRSKVLEIAEAIGYRFPSQGDLSFFAERLRDKLSTEPMIRDDLRRKVSP
ncbi:MAG: hypothetical protein HZC17_05945 [Candidatus Omnitrophica bacterium]|nr:hypothetical protein [Candidatus Omnitrophota bacterium]